MEGVGGEEVMERKTRVEKEEEGEDVMRCSPLLCSHLISVGYTGGMLSVINPTLVSTDIS